MAFLALGKEFEFHITPPEFCSTGIPKADGLTGGFPRGCLTEICGESGGGFSLLRLRHDADFDKVRHDLQYLCPSRHTEDSRPKHQPPHGIKLTEKAAIGPSAL
jgi:hypothetical protein